MDTNSEFTEKEDYERGGFENVRGFNYSKYRPIEEDHTDAMEISSPLQVSVCGIRCTRKFKDYSLICKNETCQSKWHPECLFRKYNVKDFVDDTCPKCNFDLYVKFRS